MRGERKNELGFLQIIVTPRFVVPKSARDCPSAMDSSQRFGPDSAQVGECFRGLGLRCFNFCTARAGAGRIEVRVEIESVFLF
jgi:hypothetical protein